MTRVRPYRPEDHDAVYDICVRTGHAGGDARAVYPDHDLLPNIFAGPYVALEPHLAFVVDDGERAVGYIVGTADTAGFVRAYRERWLPGLADRYPPPVDNRPRNDGANDGGGPATPTERMIWLMHHPETMIRPELADHPAHLHIDLLPDHQGMGHGRVLMTTFLAALHTRGVPAAHLGMASANTAARAFYDRLGFTEIPVAGAADVTYLGRTTAPS